MSSFGMARVLEPWQQTLMSPYLKWKTPDFLFRLTYDVLAELTDDKDLIAVLCGQWGDTGTFFDHDRAKLAQGLSGDVIESLVSELTPRGLRYVDMEGGETFLHHPN